MAGLGGLPQAGFDLDRSRVHCLYCFGDGLLDGSDQPLVQQEIHTIPTDEFRSGMRLRAKFKPKAERDVSSIDNNWMFCSTGDVVECWEHTGEPDAPVADGITI